METAKDFTDLIVWQKGHSLVLAIYQLTKKFPTEEKFALTSQMRRASVSITSNIAEGFGRHGTKDKEHFYVMSSGSLTELLNQLLIAKDLDYITQSEFEKVSIVVQDVKQLLNGLLRAHRDKSRP